MYTINNIYGYKSANYIKKVIDYALEYLKLNNVVFSIILIDDIEMKKLNNQYRNIDKTTDVLSFALEDNEKKVKKDIRLLGDIYISIPQMQKQALENGKNEKDEYALLAVHGLLHLLGYDHMKILNKIIMFKLQEEILHAKR